MLTNGKNNITIIMINNKGIIVVTIIFINTIINRIIVWNIETITVINIVAIIIENNIEVIEIIINIIINNNSNIDLIIRNNIITIRIITIRKNININHRLIKYINKKFYHGYVLMMIE